MFIFYLFVIFGLGLAFAANVTGNETANSPYNIGLTTTVSRLVATLKIIAPQLSILLVILSGIVYAFSISQPPESRGKMQSIAVGLLIGGIIIAAFAFAAGQIEQGSEGLLKG